MMSRCLTVSLALATILSSQGAPCTTCKDGTPVSLPDKLIDFLPRVPSLTCGEIEGLGREAFQTNTANCDQIQSLGTLCGCARDEGACTLCGDGSDVPDEYKRVPVDLPAFTAIFQDADGFTPICDFVEAYLHSLPSQHEFCSYSQRTAAISCGCPEPPSFSNDNATKPEYFDPSAPVDVPKLEADDFEIGFYGVESESQLKMQYRITRASAILSILVALVVITDTLRNRKRRKNLYNQIVTLMAVFDILASIAFSLLDIPRPADDVLKTPNEMGNSATCTAQSFFIQWGQSTSLSFNAALSTYYLVSIVYCYTETKINKLRKYLICVPLALGLILALASIPFISYGTTGCFIVHPKLADALAALGIIDQKVGWGPLLGFVIIPIYLVLLYTTGTMIRVYWYVRKTDKRSSKRTFRSQAANGSSIPSSSSTAQRSSAKSPSERRLALLRSKSQRTSKKSTVTVRSATSRLRREVAWQSLWYLFALYITWGLYATVNLTQGSYTRDHYHFWNFYFFLLPLQGFINAWVYFRPRLSRRFSAFLDDLKKRRAQAKERPENTVDGTPEDLRSSQKSRKLLLSRFRLGGILKPHEQSDFHDVEPAVELLSANLMERASRMTLDSVVEREGSTHDVDPQGADEEKMLPTSVGDGLGMAPEGDVTSIALQSDASEPDDPEGIIASNEVIAPIEKNLGEAQVQGKETPESREGLVVTSEAAVSRGSFLKRMANPNAKAVSSRRRRSSLQMLVETIVGVDGTDGSRGSFGSDSDASGSS